MLPTELADEPLQETKQHDTCTSRLEYSLDQLRTVHTALRKGFTAIAWTPMLLTGYLSDHAVPRSLSGRATSCLRFPVNCCTDLTVSLPSQAGKQL